MDSSFFVRAKKAVWGALLAGLGALAAGWLSGHHLNWVEALDAVVTFVVTGGVVYNVRNGRAVEASRTTRDGPTL